ncbi:GyrI-like domain-containing protein [Blastococcus brunescens]|uniref:GyrI-like domain-containing protein n=1 Tax=Blastococcus brunescens TaxID=1564165 RepID=A0ABZ1BAH1_9ACTN|nr:GyrI-like domain-containing protein [Blastococcus sp. BMG 8361]WRL66963.1 GyrI-like domain-containing protein [Blastococcus sp. BMG 8361]
MATFSTDDKSDWDWTLMILLPEQATTELVEEARTRTAEKKGLEAIGRVRFERFAEGPAAQVLHVGPYSAEGPTVAALHAFIAEQGCLLSGRHHEIYLGDPRRAAPEKLRTIVRQPVAGPQA